MSHWVLGGAGKTFGGNQITPPPSHGVLKAGASLRGCCCVPLRLLLQALLLLLLLLLLSKSASGGGRFLYRNHFAAESFERNPANPKAQTTTRPPWCWRFGRVKFRTFHTHDNFPRKFPHPTFSLPCKHHWVVSKGPARICWTSSCTALRETPAAKATQQRQEEEEEYTSNAKKRRHQQMSGHTTTAIFTNSPKDRGQIHTLRRMQQPHPHTAHMPHRTLSQTAQNAKAIFLHMPLRTQRPCSLRTIQPPCLRAVQEVEGGFGLWAYLPESEEGLRGPRSAALGKLGSGAPHSPFGHAASGRGTRLLL